MQSAQMCPEDFWPKCYPANGPQRTFGPIACTRLFAGLPFCRMSPEDFWCKCIRANCPQKTFGPKVASDLWPNGPQRPLAHWSSATFGPKVAEGHWAKGPWRPLGQRSPGTFGPEVAEDHWAKGPPPKSPQKAFEHAAPQPPQEKGAPPGFELGSLSSEAMSLTTALRSLVVESPSHQ